MEFIAAHNDEDEEDEEDEEDGYEEDEGKNGISSKGGESAEVKNGLQKRKINKKLNKSKKIISRKIKLKFEESEAEEEKALN